MWILNIWFAPKEKLSCCKNWCLTGVGVAVKWRGRAATTAFTGGKHCSELSWSQKPVDSKEMKGEETLQKKQEF